MSEHTEKVYKILQELHIPYTRHCHPPVETVAEAEEYWAGIEGAHCKNLFLRNPKGNKHILLIVEFSKLVDLRSFGKASGLGRLSFASSERLYRYLEILPGSVSPFGLINDKQNHVEVYIDELLKHSTILNFHPNENTETVGIRKEDFIKYLDWTGNRYQFTAL